MGLGVRQAVDLRQWSRRCRCPFSAQAALAARVRAAARGAHAYSGPSRYPSSRASRGACGGLRMHRSNAPRLGLLPAVRSDSESRTVRESDPSRSRLTDKDEHRRGPHMRSIGRHEDTARSRPTYRTSVPRSRGHGYQQKCAAAAVGRVASCYLAIHRYNIAGGRYRIALPDA